MESQGYVPAFAEELEVAKIDGEEGGDAGSGPEPATTGPKGRA
jgi:hypothetical protein